MTPFASEDHGLAHAEVLRRLKNFLNMDRPEHHSIAHLKERGVLDKKLSTLDPPRSGTESLNFN